MAGNMDQRAAAADRPAPDDPRKNAFLGHYALAHLVENGAPSSMTFLTYLRYFQFDLADAQPVQKGDRCKVQPLRREVFAKSSPGKDAAGIAAKSLHDFSGQNADLAVPWPGMGVAGHTVGHYHRLGYW